MSVCFLITKRAINDTQSKCLGSTIRVLIHPSMTSKVTEYTLTQSVSENTTQSQMHPNQQVTPLNILESTQQASEKPNPILHFGPTSVASLTTTRESTMDSAVSERHITDGRDQKSDCKYSQTFAGRISLFRSNWEALTRSCGSSRQ